MLPLNTRSNTLRQALFGLAVWLSAAVPAAAQLPLPRFDRIYPPGGRAGAVTEVTVSGADVEEITGLRADHPGLRAELVKQEGNSATFRLTAALGTPLGTHDLRLVSRYGVSNPMLWDVQDLPEVLEKEPNNLPAQANPVALNCVVNGTADGNSEDYFAFSARKGQRVIVDCLAYRIGSTMDGTLVLLNKAGKELALNRDFNGPDPFIDFSVPEDGDYLVKLYDFNYAGGTPYRLRITTLPYLDSLFPLAVEPGRNSALTLLGRNLPAGAPAGLMGDGASLEKLSVSLGLPPLAGKAGTSDALDYAYHPRSSSGNLDAFSYRFPTAEGASNPLTVGIAKAPIVEEREPNNSLEAAQEITLPAEVNGRLATRGDEDWFAVTLKAGQVLAVEAYCERMGYQGDPVVLIQNAKGEDLSELDDSGPQYQGSINGRNRDPEGRFTAPAAGKYYVLLTDRYQRGGARFLYRLRLSEPIPDYRAVLLHTTEPRPSAPTVRQGGSTDYRLIIIRQDGWDGEVHYQAEGLPTGVTCTPGVVGLTMQYAPVVFTAAPDAPPAEADIRLLTWAMIDGKRVEREARAIVQIFEGSPGSRLARNIALAVRPSAPYALTVSPANVTAAPGATVELRVSMQRRWPEVTGVCQVTGLEPPPGCNVPAVNIPAAQTEATVKITAPQRPGAYSLVLRGDAQVPFSRDPTGKDKKDVRVTDPAPPIQITVTPAAAVH